jgi:hypothetical protein
MPGGAPHLPGGCASVLWCVGLPWMQLPVATREPVMAHERAAGI